MFTMPILGYGWFVTLLIYSIAGYGVSAGVDLLKKAFSDAGDEDVALEINKEALRIQAESLEQQQAGQAAALEQTISYLKNQSSDNKLREQENFYSRTNAALDQTMLQSLSNEIGNRETPGELLATAGHNLLAAGSQPRPELGFMPQTMPTVTEGINPLSPVIRGF